MWARNSLLSLCIAAVLPLLGCDRSGGTGESGKLRVVATTTMIGDLVQRIGGERVELKVIMGPGVDPHTFKPAPADFAELSRARLAFYNGLHLEGKMVETFEHKLAEGKTKKDAIRSLKRHISNAVYRQLLSDADRSKR